MIDREIEECILQTYDILINGINERKQLDEMFSQSNINDLLDERKHVKKLFEKLRNGGMHTLRDVEVFHIETKDSGMHAHISYQDPASVDDINNGYNHIIVPIKPRAVQMSAHDNVLVNQSEQTDRCVDAAPEKPNNLRN